MLYTILVLEADLTCVNSSLHMKVYMAEVEDSTHVHMGDSSKNSRHTANFTDDDLSFF